MIKLGTDAVESPRHRHRIDARTSKKRSRAAGTDVPSDLFASGLWLKVPPMLRGGSSPHNQSFLRCLQIYPEVHVIVIVDSRPIKLTTEINAIYMFIQVTRLVRTVASVSVGNHVPEELGVAWLLYSLVC